MSYEMVSKIRLVLAVAFMLITDSACKSIQNDSLINDLTELRQTVVDLSVKMQSLNDSLQHKRNPVMFYALMKGKSFTRNVDTTLVFETVIINEGGHYDPYDGVFVGPEEGIYLFAWTVTCNGAKWMVTELVVEEKVIASAGEYNGGGGHSSGSMTALCKMDKGDHAWIRTTGVSSEHKIYSHNDYPQTAFLGILIKRNN